MLFLIQLLDNQQKAWFSGERELAGDYILKLAADRLPLFKEKGAEFAQGAVPAMAAALVKVVKAGANEAVTDKAVIELALSIVTVESFFGVDDAALKNRSFKVTVYENGAVQIDNLDQ